MTDVYFYFEHNTLNVRGHWEMDSPPVVGDEVQLWEPSESETTCIVVRRRWATSKVLDVFVGLVDRSEVES